MQRKKKKKENKFENEQDQDKDKELHLSGSKITTQEKIYGMKLQEGLDGVPLDNLFMSRKKGTFQIP